MTTTLATPGSYTGERGDPAASVVPVTPSSSDLSPPARAVWAAADGTMDFVDLSGNSISSFPIFKGPNPVGAKRITAATVTVYALA